MEEETVVKVRSTYTERKPQMPATKPIAPDNSESAACGRPLAANSDAVIPSFALEAKIESADTGKVIGDWSSEVLMGACCFFLCRGKAETHAC